MLPAFEFNYLLSSNEVGAVYQAFQKSLDRQVAIKLFSPGLSRAASFHRRFLASCSKAAELRHPNLISLFDSGEVEGMHYLVMEFVPGKSLWRSMQGNSIELKQTLGVIEELCAGLAFAHEQGVVHGNLSPLNILLNQKASPKIGNFLLGRDIHTNGEQEVPDQFIAPEVRDGNCPTEASDIFAIAVLFYEMLTATPWRPDGPPASSLEGTPVAIDKVLRNATQADPSQRPDDIHSFLKSLRNAAKGPRMASGGAKPSQPRPTPKSFAHKARGTSMTVKVVAILVLLIAIHQTWSYRQRVLAEQKAEPNEPARVVIVKKAEPNQAQVVGNKPRPQNPGRPQVPTQPAQPEPDSFPMNAETPMDSLERLQDALARGVRSEMPVGTVQHGDSHYFMVTEAMTWPQASAFAQEHGGHLALPESDMAWCQKEPMVGSSFWVGAAASGPSSYTRVDGKALKAAPVSGSGPYLHRDQGGNYVAAGKGIRRPFVIQWQQDGSNPASLESQLRQTAKSIQSGDPVYPPGTIALGERRYLALACEASWEEAVKLAQEAGGHLMALSTAEEAAQDIGRQFSGVSGKLWMGGHLVDDFWTWDSGESWQPINWANEDHAAENGAAMILHPGHGWNAMPKSATADGFVIEWSDDPKTHAADPGAAPVFASASKLAETARELVVKAGEDKEAAHTKNTDKVAWDLDSHIRGLNKSEQQKVIPEIEKLKACVQDNRLHPETIQKARVRMTPVMAKVANYVIEKQASIDEDYEAELLAIHSHYLAKLEEVRDQAKAMGQVKIQRDAARQIEDAQNAELWLARIQP